MSPGFTMSVRKALNQSYDLNTLLQVANAFILFFTLWAYIVTGGNQYVDGFTVAISVMFALQSLFLLWWEKRSREPLLLLLIIIIIPFYQFRVLTLLYEPWSAVLVRFPFTQEDMNYAYLFIMFSVMAMSLGIKLGERGKKSTVQIYSGVGRLERRGFTLMLLSLLIDLAAALGVTIPCQGFISVILNADIILVFFMVIYFALDKEGLLKIPKQYYWILLIAFLVIRTLNGSRAALLTVTLSIVFVLLSLNHQIMIKKWVVTALVALIPLSIFCFSIVTFYRPFLQAKRLGGTDVMPENFISEYINSMTADPQKDGIKIALRPVFDRAGYLDMAADMITNHERYRVVINPSYYLKSVVDNVLTPGFDLFDMPRAANNTVTIYNDLPLQKRSEVSTFYQSDMFTIFGENYILFGWFFAPFIIFVTGCLLKVLFDLIDVSNGIFFHASKAILYKIYVLLICSFGMDWQIGDITFFIISCVFIYFILKVKIPQFVGRELCRPND